MGFQKIYDLRGPWGRTAVFQLICELRKNWRGRVDGWTDEGSIRGPRGPKKMTHYLFLPCQGLNRNFWYPIILSAVICLVCVCAVKWTSYSRSTYSIQPLIIEDLSVVLPCCTRCSRSAILMAIVTCNCTSGCPATWGKTQKGRI